MSHIVKIEDWLVKNTYQYNEMNLDELEKLKSEKNLTVAVVIPTLEEESTIYFLLDLLIKKLTQDHKIIDELVIIDGGSKDKTKELCELFKDIKFFSQNEILSEMNLPNKGKGEALWKSLYVTKSDIVIYVDADIKNFDERFVVGILGPMLLNDNVKFVKGYYERPYMPKEGVKSYEGGRVTEICARPLLNMLYPELSGFIQPLGGEYGGYRDVLENIEYTSGYSIEVQSLIEILNKCGLDKIAQCNLIERQHRHQPINSLSKMSFAIMQTILSKNISRELCNTIMIKNSKKENSEFVKSRSESLDHCNCHGNDMENDYFNYVDIKEVTLPKMSEVKENTLKESISSI